MVPISYCRLYISSTRLNQVLEFLLRSSDGQWRYMSFTCFLLAISGYLRAINMHCLGLSRSGLCSRNSIKHRVCLKRFCHMSGVQLLVLFIEVKVVNPLFIASYDTVIFSSLLERRLHVSRCHCAYLQSWHQFVDLSELLTS